MNGQIPAAQRQFRLGTSKQAARIPLPPVPVPAVLRCTRDPAALAGAAPLPSPRGQPASRPLLPAPCFPFALCSDFSAHHVPPLTLSPFSLCHLLLPCGSLSSWHLPALGCSLWPRSCCGAGGSYPKVLRSPPHPPQRAAAAHAPPSAHTAAGVRQLRPERVSVLSQGDAAQ